MHLPTRPICILWKSLSNSLTTPHCAHCLHHARRVSCCHHPALSNSGSYSPLHQKPGKSRMGSSTSNLSAICLSWKSQISGSALRSGGACHKNRTNPKNAMPGGGEMCPPHKFLNSAGLFIRFVPAYLCLELHYVATPFFILCDCHLPHVFYLSDEACTHRVHVDGHLFTEFTLSGTM